MNKSGGGGARDSKGMPVESSWEDLTVSSVPWYKVSWSWENIAYWMQGIKGKARVYLNSSIGLAATDTNIKHYGSHKGVFIQNLKMVKACREHNVRFLVHPFSAARITFDVITCLILLFQVVYLPIQLCFGYTDTFSAASVSFEIFADLWFLADIYMNFCTCVQLDGKDCLMDPEDIANHYLTGWFPLDLISTIPLEIFFEITYLPNIISNNLPKDNPFFLDRKVQHRLALCLPVWWRSPREPVAIILLQQLIAHENF